MGGGGMVGGDSCMDPLMGGGDTALKETKQRHETPPFVEFMG